MTAVTLSLISHTNVGKTTLARTLLRRDVGEVLDQAHVTEVSETHLLVQAGEHSLRLWDTPGFGDTARLLARLRRQGDPLGWFLHQVWDRIVDRPLWCGQEAVRNVKQDADVVLYLVSATEDPADAGYVPLELELLAWLDKPVVLLLNQTGPAGTDADALERWQALAASHAIVRDVASLDAFTRCWVAEGELLRRIVTVLADDKRDAMTALADEWERGLLETYRRSVDRLAAHVVRAASDAAPLGGETGRGARRAAVEQLTDRQQLAARELTEELLALHSLDGAAAAAVQAHLEQDFELPSAGLQVGSSALWGSIVSGAVGGLAADAMAGGLTLGGGMLAGALLGAAGGAGLARAYQLVGAADDPSVSWSRGFLEELCRESLLRYLAVAHFGRGRGQWVESDAPRRWTVAVEEALVLRSRELREVLENLQASRRADSPHAERERIDAQVDAQLRDLLDGALRDTLRGLYPSAAEWLVQGAAPPS